MEGAKDPDEYIIKYGNARFQALIDKALSIVEFKVKQLRKNLDLENTVDKIKFLNEIAKLIAKIDNSMEREVYIDKIARTYNVSKEAIYAEVNKLSYADNKGQKILEQAKAPKIHLKSVEKEVPEAIEKRENTILSIVLRGDLSIFQIIKQNILPEDFKSKLNKKIAQKVYEELEKGNSNINAIIDDLSEEEQSHITMIMAQDDGIEDIEKAIDELMQAYQKQKLNERKYEILTLLEDDGQKNNKKELEKELSNIILQLAKIR